MRITATTPPSSRNRNVWFTEQFGNILDFFGPTGGPADVSTSTVGTLYGTSQAAPDIKEGMGGNAGQVRSARLILHPPISHGWFRGHVPYSAKGALGSSRVFDGWLGILLLV